VNRWGLRWQGLRWQGLRWRGLRWRDPLVLCAALLVWLSLLLSAAPARAHEIKPAVLGLKEVSPGRFLVNWSAPEPLGPAEPRAVPRFPAHCELLTAEGQRLSVVDCGARGLTGSIGFEPAVQLIDGVSVHVQWLSGAERFVVTQGYPPQIELSSLPQALDVRQRLNLALHYGKLGVEHIVFGWDHLLFVLGLMLIVRAPKLLLGTITAFTFAHSLTLAAASLGWAQVPSAPVELCIALSVLLLAVEAATQQQSWTRRAPWAVAFLFGLLHGLGFASALSDTGLPPGHVVVSLLSFNVGVELGQLCAMAAAALVWKSLARSARAAARLQFVVVLTLGTAATTWTLQRAEALLLQ
jgi:hypothetical protein